MILCNGLFTWRLNLKLCELLLKCRIAVTPKTLDRARIQQKVHFDSDCMSQFRGWIYHTILHIIHARPSQKRDTKKSITLNRRGG